MTQYIFSQLLLQTQEAGPLNAIIVGHMTSGLRLKRSSPCRNEVDLSLLARGQSFQSCNDFSKLHNCWPLRGQGSRGHGECPRGLATVVLGTGAA